MCLSTFLLCAEFPAQNLQSLFNITVHSGSRGLGQSILSKHIAEYSTNGLEVNSPSFQSYLASHDAACQWAVLNRNLIARRILDTLIPSDTTLQHDDTTRATKLIDIWHNNMEKKVFADGKERWIHRKGAAPSDRGPVVIPGSRGACSYVVIPYGDQEGNGE